MISNKQQAFLNDKLTTEMSPKLKKLIVKYLIKDLMSVEIIYYRDSVWFIDREQKYWYFEYHKTDKHLWWRWSHFQSALKIFSMNGEENQSIFGELVNMILNKKQNLETKYPDKVFKTVGSIINFKEEVKEVLNHEVKTSLCGEYGLFGMMEEVLNCEVETTNRVRQRRYEIVEKVLNNEVKTTAGEVLSLPATLEEVLNHGVETTKHLAFDLYTQVEEVLNHDVETIGEAYHNDDYVTEEILNNTINTYRSGELVDEEKQINNVLNYGTDTIEIKTIEKLRGENDIQNFMVSEILNNSEKVTDKLKIVEDKSVKTYGHNVFMCNHLVQNVLDIGSNSISYDTTSQQGRVDGVLKNS